MTQEEQFTKELEEIAYNNKHTSWDKTDAVTKFGFIIMVIISLPLLIPIFLIKKFITN